MKINEIITEAGIGMGAKRRQAKRRQQYANAQKTGLWFKGYRCTKDCSGHRAGYNWAKGKGINKPNQCNLGHSKSFWEGCKSCGEGK